MRKTWLLLLLLLTGTPAFAEIHLSGVFSDHAVLQRDVPIHVWGSAKPGEHVDIALDSVSVAATASPYGLWEAYLPAQKAGGPRVLRVKGDAGAPAVERRDILIGDVWIASGQSNMEMPLQGFASVHSPVSGGEAVIAAANAPTLRLFTQSRRTALAPVADTSDNWATVSPDTVRNFSAVAYFFAQSIQKAEHVPIGIIVTSWGGTPAHTWMSAEGLSWANVPSVALDAGAIARQQALVDEAQANATLQGPGVTFPKFGDHQDSYIPSACFNGMVAPFTRYTIKGWIWYQGETDANEVRPAGYSRLFPALIQDWRKQWQQGPLPFLYVQISSFGRGGNAWGQLRDAQRRTLDLVNTGMAVTLDIGSADNVHPPDKRTVGERLALPALHLAYGVEAPGASPTFLRASLESGAVRAWFSNARKLDSHDKPVGDFEVAGADRKFVPATARVEQVDGVPTVVAAAPSVPDPKFIRYGWNPVVLSYLYNETGLPLGTFTSESDTQMSGQ